MSQATQAWPPPGTATPFPGASSTTQAALRRGARRRGFSGCSSCGAPAFRGRSKRARAYCREAHVPHCPSRACASLCGRGHGTTAYDAHAPMPRGACATLPRMRRCREGGKRRMPPRRMRIMRGRGHGTVAHAAHVPWCERGTSACARRGFSFALADMFGMIHTVSHLISYSDTNAPLDSVAPSLDGDAKNLAVSQQDNIRTVFPSPLVPAFLLPYYIVFARSCHCRCLRGPGRERGRMLC